MEPLLNELHPFIVEYGRRNGKSFTDMCKMIQEYNRVILDKFYLGMSSKAWDAMLEYAKETVFDEEDSYVGSIRWRILWYFNNHRQT